MACSPRWCGLSRCYHTTHGTEPTLDSILWRYGTAGAGRRVGLADEHPRDPLLVRSPGARAHTLPHRSPTRTGPCTFNAVGLLSSGREMLCECGEGYPAPSLTSRRCSSTSLSSRSASAASASSRARRCSTSPRACGTRARTQSERSGRTWSVCDGGGATAIEEEQRTLRIDRGEERLSHQHFVQAGLGSRFLGHTSHEK